MRAIDFDHLDGVGVELLVFFKIDEPAFGDSGFAARGLLPGVKVNRFEDDLLLRELREFAVDRVMLLSIFVMDFDQSTNVAVELPIVNDRLINPRGQDIEPKITLDKLLVFDRMVQVLADDLAIVDTYLAFAVQNDLD